MRLIRVLVLMMSAVLGNAILVYAQSEFSATLSGANEVPAVATIGFGSATFDVNISGGVLGIDYELTGVNVTDAFMAHIHCGAPGQNGPVMVYLAGDASTTPATLGYDLNGAWVRAKLKESAVIAGTPCGTTLTDLLFAMINGQTYVNIHTRANPGGVIRGQIALVAPFTLP